MKAFSGSKEEILSQFGYCVDESINSESFRVFIKDDPEAYQISGNNRQELIDEAYEFLMFEISENMGYNFEVTK